MAVSLDRRQFLRASSGFLLGLGLAQLPRDVAAIRDATDVRPDIWQELASLLRGSLLLPGDSGFSQAAQPWNLRFASHRPAAIARCTSVEDARSCLLWAQANDMPFVARGGGHSYAGYSSTNGLQIDLSPMHQVSYDAATGLAHLDGGVCNSDVYASLRSVDRALTHGRCGAVGVAGLTLGGGIGFNQRRRGLTCDQLVETEVLVSSGALLRCNEQENSDLFWACRGGGGGNFGVNTSLTFQTFAVSSLTAYQVLWTTNVDDLLPAALEVLPTTNDRLGCKLSVVNNGAGLSLELLGQFEGSPTDLRALLDPLYRIATPSKETVQVLPYWDAQDFLSDEGTPVYSHERSRYIFRPVPPDGSRTILQYVRDWPGTGASANWKMFLTGGAVADVPPEATAFVHRSALMISSIGLEWTAGDSVGSVVLNEVWLAEFHEAMRPYSSDESYQNFIDEDQTDFLHAYYGANLGRLVQIKQRYDPQSAFRFPEGIPLALDEGTPKERIPAAAFGTSISGR